MRGDRGWAKLAGGGGRFALRRGVCMVSAWYLHGINVVFPRQSAERSRFIPAGAGSALGGLQSAWPFSVRPRWPGVRSHPCRAASVGLGFIPAGAGSAGSRGTFAFPGPVHPRGAGSAFRHILGIGSQGSSRLLRGLRPEISALETPSGFIPGGAGSAWICSPLKDQEPVHPRVCGVLNGDVAQRRSCAGSSPLARGLHHGVPLYLPRFRFIPAGAGSAEQLAVFPAHCKVHPRCAGSTMT